MDSISSMNGIKQIFVRLDDAECPDFMEQAGNKKYKTGIVSVFAGSFFVESSFDYVNGDAAPEAGQAVRKK